MDPLVACLDDRGALFEALRERGIPCHFIGRRRGLDLPALWRLRRLLREQRIDVLNTHGLSAALWGRVAVAAERTPRVVVTAHAVAGWKQPRKQYLCSRLLQPLTDRFVAVSESVRRSLIEKERTPPDLIRVIGNGIRLERFRRSTDPEGDRRRLGLASDGFLVGMVARCNPEKGGAVWVRAVAALIRAGIPIRGVLVGDGPERAAWQALAAEMNIAGSVCFAGEQTDVTPWLSVMDVLVCPSLQESFGLAAVEAQAAGVPVVATRVDGFLEVLHDGVDTLLVPPGDSAALAAAIRSLCDSPDLARRLVEAGRRNAARFTVERTAAQYAALYRELLEEAPRRYQAGVEEKRRLIPQDTSRSANNAIDVVARRSPAACPFRGASASIARPLAGESRQREWPISSNR
jgi:glycosyltransferase involved in cell wall biosynthesis